MCFDSVLSVKSLQVDYHIGKQKTELIKKKKNIRPWVIHMTSSLRGLGVGKAKMRCY